MTVATTLVFSEYTADGSTTAFGLNAYCQTADQVEVLIDDVVQSDAAYTVSGLRSPTGVTATFSTAPTSGTVRVRRVLPLTQEVDTQNNEVTYQEVFDDALDRQVMTLQQLQEEISRAIKVAQGDTAPAFPAAADRVAPVGAAEEVGEEAGEGVEFGRADLVPGDAVEERVAVREADHLDGPLDDLAAPADPQVVAVAGTGTTPR